MFLVARALVLRPTTRAPPTYQHQHQGQSALVGVSNSYNLVGFYEDNAWSIRGA